MQRSERLGRTLGFAALLFFTAIQAIGVDSSPTGSYTFQQPAFALRPETDAVPPGEVVPPQHLPETRGPPSFVYQPTDDANDAGLIGTPGSEESAEYITQDLVPGPGGPFSAATFNGYSPKFPYENLLSRLSHSNLQFSGSAALVRSCEDGSCLPNLYSKFLNELAYVSDAFYRAERVLEDFVAVYQDFYQRHALPRLTEEFVALIHGVSTIRVSPPMRNVVDYLTSWTKHHLVAQPADVSRPLPDETAPVYPSYNDVSLQLPEHLSGSMSPNGFTGLKGIELRREARENSENSTIIAEINSIAQTIGLNKYIPYITDTAFPLLIRMSASLTFLDELINAVEDHTSIPIHEYISKLCQELDSSGWGPLVKLARIGFDIAEVVMPPELTLPTRFARRGEYTDTDSNGYVENAEGTLDDGKELPRGQFRIGIPRVKRSFISIPTDLVNQLMEPFSQVTSTITEGIYRARDWDLDGALDHGLEAARLLVKQVNGLQLDKMLQFADIILERIAPKKRRTERDVPLIDEGDSVYRPQQGDFHRLPAHEEPTRFARRGEYKDTDSNGYVENAEGTLDDGKELPRVKRSYISLPTDLGKRLMEPFSQVTSTITEVVNRLMEPFSEVTSTITEGIYSARDWDLDGALDHGLDAARLIVKQINGLQLDKVLQFADIILERIAPKKRRTERDVPLIDEGDSVHRPQQGDFHRLPAHEEPASALEKVLLQKMGPGGDLPSLLRHRNNVYGNYQPKSLI